jgi:hypothetical protein
VWRWLHGSHPFCDTPARAYLPDRVRLVLMADWGTGREGAKKVGQHAQEAAYDAPGAAHVIHLGDTYYSGTPREARDNILALWPVGPASASEIGSWALNGNHDMYSGGHGLFETTLGDHRFHRQQVDGKPTSWFLLQTPNWNILGLDTAWKHPLIEINGGAPYFDGSLGHLEGSQADVVALCQKDLGRRLLVHQPPPALQRLRPPLGLPRHVADDAARGQARADPRPPASRRPVLGPRARLPRLEPFEDVLAARAIGHGAVPVEVRTQSRATPLGGGAPEYVVKPALGDDPTGAMQALKWEYRGAHDDGDWAKHGFAILDIDGRGLDVSYVDEDGTTWLRESL